MLDVISTELGNLLLPWIAGIHLKPLRSTRGGQAKMSVITQQPLTFRPCSTPTTSSSTSHPSASSGATDLPTDDSRAWNIFCAAVRSRSVCRSFSVAVPSSLIRSSFSADSFLAFARHSMTSCSRRSLSDRIVLSSPSLIRSSES